MTGTLKNRGRLQMENFHGCTTTRMHSKPLDRTLRNGKFYGTYVLPQFKKINQVHMPKSLSTEIDYGHSHV